VEEALLISKARVITPTGVLEDGWVETNDRRVVAIGEGPRRPPVRGTRLIDAQGGLLGPGLVDIHTHGAVGHEVMDGGAALSAIRAFLATRGVSSFVATTWSAPHESILAALDAVRANLGPSVGGATILGAHLEGPYLNVEAAGAQDPAAIRPLDRAELEELLSTEVVRIVTVAPEIGDNLHAVAACVERGATVSIGHTAATFEQVSAAADRGATMMTHLFNAMTPLRHRAPGAVGAGLTDPRLSGELVADGIHVHPAVLRLALAAMGIARVVLVSDGVRACGMPEGELNLDGRQVVHADGAVRLADGTLAGSALTLDMALRNFAAATGRAIEEVWAAASHNPARALDIDDHKGTIDVGKDADLTLLDSSDEVVLTVADGNVVYSREQAAGRHRLAVQP
jgi:N-acetylglucosamine-6-phosphate deacetylase